MGVSTDAQICHVVPFDEDHEFPWNGEKFDIDDDAESWWRTVNGYAPPFHPLTDEGEYAEGWSRDDPRFDKYFAHRREWDEQNPMPFTLVNYCSGDCPMYMLAVPGTLVVSNRGFPAMLDNNTLVLPCSGKVARFAAFIAEHFPGVTDEPRWYLSSYWG